MSILVPFKPNAMQCVRRTKWVSGVGIEKVRRRGERNDGGTQEREWVRKMEALEETDT